MQKQKKCSVGEDINCLAWVGETNQASFPKSLVSLWYFDSKVKTLAI